MDIWQIIVSAIGLVVGLAGYIEKRLEMQSRNFEAKLEDRNKINEVIQNSLKEQITRLEAKIDMLLQMNLEKSHGNRNIQD